MAEFRAWDAFDLREFNFGAMLRLAYDYWVDNSEFDVHGISYPMALILQQTEADDASHEFYGHDLTITDGALSGGRFNAYYSWFIDEGDGEWYYNYEFRGFDIAASALQTAMESYGVGDDRALIAQMLSGADRVVLSSGADWFRGHAGNDTMQGGAGYDTLLGDTGADVLNGGRGGDWLDGGRGADVLTGGEGADAFVLAALPGRDRITDFQDGIDAITIRSGANSFDELELTARAAGVLVSFDSGSALVLGMTLANLTEDDFLFT